MTVVGGVGHVWGALTGAALTKLLDDQLQVLLPRLIGTSGSYEVIVFGIALVMMLKYQPDGLWDFVERRLPRAHRARWTGPTRRRCPSAPSPPTGELVLDVQDGAQGVRRPGRGQRRQLPDPRRRDRRADRPQRRGQVHHLQPDHRRAARPRAATSRFRGETPERPAVARDRAQGHGAHLPARQDDPRHDGARKRRAGRAHARPQGRAQRDGARWTAPRSGRCSARRSASSNASAWAP